MADILIGKINDATKELLRRRAERRGKSLEADLRDTLVRLAREEAETPDDTEPFGSWLVSISRPGIDLDEALAALRSGPMRPVSFESRRMFLLDTNVLSEALKPVPASQVVTWLDPNFSESEFRV